MVNVNAPSQSSFPSKDRQLHSTATLSSGDMHAATAATVAGRHIVSFRSHRLSRSILQLPSAPWPAMPPRRGLFQQSAGASALAWLPWLLRLLAAGTWAFCLIFLPDLGGSRGGRGTLADGGLRLLPAQHLQARGRTLVVYVFSGSDPEYADNLRFFVSEAVKVCGRSAAPPPACLPPVCRLTCAVCSRAGPSSSSRSRQTGP